MVCAEPEKAQPKVEEKTKPPPAAVSSIASDELADFDHYTPELKALVEDSLALTHLNLAYTFGGSSPTDGGMDCSGTIYYLLTQRGIKDVPRSSDEICEWVRERSGLHLAPDGVELSNEAFSALRPGDLLFWTGTYETLPRKLPVSHIMMYLGTLKSNGKPVVVGSSDGRSFQGSRRSGVSVFDFSMPRAGSKAAFYGYGTIPGLAKISTGEQVRKAQPPPGKKLAVADDDTSTPKAKPKVAKTDSDDEEKPKAKPKIAKADSDDEEAPKPKVKPKSIKTNSDDEDAPKPKVKPKVAKMDSDDDTPKPKPKIAKKNSDDEEAATPKPKPKVVKADGDDDAAPKKPAPRRKSPASTKKAAAHDIDPGAAVRKAVDSIRKAFD